jgi:hypothetical protein
MQYIRRGQKPPTSNAYPLWTSDFELAIHERRCYAQSGGHPHDVQTPPEIEAARHALDQHSGRRAPSPDDPLLLDEAERWQLPFQAPPTNPQHDRLLARE